MSDNSSMSLEQARKLAKALQKASLNRLAWYKPYPKQRIFHEMEKRFRLMMAANQVGKSEAGSAEVGMHATGDYPEDWKGVRFEKGIKIWAAGVTSLTTRDIVQKKLLGPDGQIGSGWIPLERIDKMVPSRGIPGAFDYAIIKHRTGGFSYIYFKSYEQGREKWQGADIDLLWFDEEPPPEIWSEGIARTTATQGIGIMTFTPLKGLSEVVRGFYPAPDSAEKGLVRMELEDARHEDGTGHISDEMIVNQVKLYPPHEREARAKGLPTLGTGLIYAVAESQIVEPEVPVLKPYWRRIIGLDMGRGNHPTAFACMIHDADTDTVHLCHTYKQTDPRIAIHAAAINSTWPKVPVAWPHDLAQRSVENVGAKFADIYKQHGVYMLHEHAQFADGNTSREAGIADLYNRMIEGRFKAPYHCSHFWDEVRLYHRGANGVVNKEFDDLMDAIRYGIMMLRFARTVRRKNWPAHANSGYDPMNPTAHRRRSWKPPAEEMH